MRLTPYSIKTGIVRKKWNERSLKEKISALILIIVSIILMTVLLDVWTIKISLWDFRYSLESNERVGTLMGSMENESLVFSDFIKGNVSENDLLKSMEATDKAVSELQRIFCGVQGRVRKLSSNVPNFSGLYNN